jgi:hypothetical protein
MVRINYSHLEVFVGTLVEVSVIIIVRRQSSCLLLLLLLRPGGGVVLASKTVKPWRA